MIETSQILQGFLNVSDELSQSLGNQAANAGTKVPVKALVNF